VDSDWQARRMVQSSKEEAGLQVPEVRHCLERNKLSIVPPTIVLPTSVAMPRGPKESTRRLPGRLVAAARRKARCGCHKAAARKARSLHRPYKSNKTMPPVPAAMSLLDRGASANDGENRVTMVPAAIA
jgi:hypothetical protein